MKVYCVGREVAPHSRVVVERFGRDVKGVPGWVGGLKRRWQDNPGDPTKGNVDELFRKLTARRGRYRLACRECGMTVAVREEKLFERFTTLDEHGVAEISLRDLAAII